MLMPDDIKLPRDPLLREAMARESASAPAARTFIHLRVHSAYSLLEGALQMSKIVGQAAKYYFEHGGSWGSEAPKTVITRILETTDKESVLKRLQAEIKNRLKINLHARGAKK